MVFVVLHDLPPDETYRQVVAALLSLQHTAESVFGKVHSDVQQKRGWPAFLSETFSKANS